MLVRHPAEIVAEREHRAVLSLPLAGAAQYLEVILVDHPQSRRADRVAEAFQPAADLAWAGAVGVVNAVEHVAPAFAFLGDVQLLHRPHPRSKERRLGKTCSSKFHP